VIGGGPGLVRWVPEACRIEWIEAGRGLAGVRRYTGYPRASNVTWMDRAGASPVGVLFGVEVVKVNSFLRSSVPVFLSCSSSLPCPRTRDTQTRQC
jgi:surface polysaccharide O-acyltransferase-like enzyme